MRIKLQLKNVSEYTSLNFPLYNLYGCYMHAYHCTKIETLTAEEIQYILQKDVI